MRHCVLGNGIRFRIFSKLVRESRASFSGLQLSGVRSNHFNYHLKSLLDSGLVSKVNGSYLLSGQGKELAVYINKYELGVHKHPFPVVGVLIRRGDEVLLSNLGREPFKGLWAISVVGRVDKGETIDESAMRQCKERTGLSPKDLKLKIVYDTRTKGEDFDSHHLFYVFKCKEFIGELKERTPERLNKWVKTSQVKKYNIFTDIPYTLEYIDKRGIHFLKAERELVGHKMGKTRITNK